MASWTLQDAKARFSELVNDALSGVPQRVSRRGKDAVVVLSADEYDALVRPKDSLVDFFGRSVERPRAKRRPLIGYLLDTNVIFELRKLKPDPGLTEWIADIPEERMFLSTITLGELRLGIDLVADATKRRNLEQWLVTDVATRFLVAFCLLRMRLQTAGGGLKRRPVFVRESCQSSTP